MNPLKALKDLADPLGIILVDHGSRRDESNQQLVRVADLYRETSGVNIVEPAHMELAEPSLATAFDRCVAAGATTVVVFPYFLAPGRHWSEDIPRLARQAASKHPGVRHLVTAPIGLHTLMGELITERIATCLGYHTQQGPRCDLCGDQARCQLS